MKVERESKMFWVWHNNKLSYKKGYYCKTCQKQYDGQLWWFPRLGYTLWLDVQCFNDKEKAVEYAKTVLKSEIKELQDIYNKIKGEK